MSKLVRFLTPVILVCCGINIAFALVRPSVPNIVPAILSAWWIGTEMERRFG